MNKFYKMNHISQWIVASLMFLAMILISVLWIDLMGEFKLGFLLIFFIVPIIQFLVSPLFTLVGLYKYLSPMLLVFGANSRVYDLHNGTSFDYLLVMRDLNPGAPFRQKILEYYIDGLLTIVDQIETEKLHTNVIIRGSTYFLSTTTVERLGFKQSKTGFPEKLNIVLNFVDLVWMYSLARSKFSLPNLLNIKTVSITGKRLLENKPKLLTLKTYLSKK